MCYNVLFLSNLPSTLHACQTILRLPHVVVNSSSVKYNSLSDPACSNSFNLVCNVAVLRDEQSRSLTVIVIEPQYA